MPEEVVQIIGVSCLFGTLMVGLVMHHWRKVMEMKAKGHAGLSDASLNELKEMRRQIEELRDTTTRYDMSFDTALQRLEQRVGQLETGRRTEQQVEQVRA